MTGVFSSLLSSCVFASLYFYATLLSPLNGKEVFAWRMLLTLPCMTLFLIVAKEHKQITALAARLKLKPHLLPALILSSGLLGVQQWLFLWAPMNDRGLDVSLGYFLLPLVMLLVGRLFYRERLTVVQCLATAAAAVGVLHQYYVVGQLSWVTLLVALGFPAYFSLRRTLGTNDLGGLWFDMLLTLPFAASLLASDHDSLIQVTRSHRLLAAVLLLGVLSAVAFLSYIVASRKLPFTLFGLLGYVEPMLITGVALLLGEAIRPEESFTYASLWIAVGLLVVDGIIRLVANRSP